MLIALNGERSTVAKKSAALESDAYLWGDKPVRWGSRMLELQGRALAASMPLHHVFEIAAFIGLELPMPLKGDEFVAALMLALERQNAAPRIESKRVPLLWRNLRHLKSSFGLNATELDIIAFRAMLRLHTGFEVLAGRYIGMCTDFLFHRRLAALFQVAPETVRRALDAEGAMVRSGLVSVQTGILGPLESRLSLSQGLTSNLLRPCKSAKDLLSSLLPPKRSAHLGLDDYPHLRGEVSLLRDHLGKAVSEHRIGVNVLLHGMPGTGKSELAAALAEDLGCPLYEVAVNATQGESFTPRTRLGEVIQTQRLIPVAGSGLLLVDESEDLFPTVWSDSEKVPTKGAINACLERNPSPTIWISNRTRHLDEAFLRRFDLVIHVAPLPSSAKRELLRKVLPPAALDESEIRRYANQRELSPAMLSRMARVAQASGTSAEPDAAKAALCHNLQILSKHYLQTLGANPLPCAASAPALGHDLGLLNTDVPLDSIIATMTRAPMGARMLLHGLPGTGKTALGKAIAERLDKPLLQRLASSLLSMWVGGTEQNLREMFDEARCEGGVLLLDEADSFLRDRSGAHARWEVTGTNELLTQMEDFQGIFICTTNRLEDMDPASLRRFDLKVGFMPLRADQRIRLIRQCCAALGIEQTASEGALDGRAATMDGLTPGDAAVALRRLRLCGEPADLDRLLEALALECRYKPGSHRAIGFLH